MLPEAAASGESGAPSYITHGRAVRQRTVDDVAVAGHPADVGGAPVDVLFLEVEHQLRRRVDVRQVAARRVHHALRLAGRARRVEDEEQVLGVHRLGAGSRVGRRCISSCYQRRGRPASWIGTSSPPPRFTTTTCLDARRRLGSRVVRLRLQRDHLAAPVAAVGGDERPCASRRSCGRAATPAENPPKTTECAAPMRAHASIAIAGFRDHAAGRWRRGRPSSMPSVFSTLAKRLTSRCSSSVGQRPGASPGSPSQIRCRPCSGAALARWRSRQL